MRRILDGGFHKLDTFTEKHKMEYAILSKDIISLALVDQIIAIQAEDFVTCDRSCTSICSKCGHQGTFTKLAMDLRLNAKKTVYQVVGRIMKLQ